MVVKAYLASGGEYGTVPINEITMQPTTATYDASTDIAHYTGDGIDAVYVNCATESYSKDWQGKEHLDGWVFPGGLGTDGQGRRHTPFSHVNNEPSGFLLTQYNGFIYGMCKYGHPSVYDAQYETDHWYYWGGSFGLINKIEFRQGAAVNELHWEELPVSTVDPTTVDPESLTPQQSGSRQSITVSWPRPLDGKILETTFEILVAPPYGSED